MPERYRLRCPWHRLGQAERTGEGGPPRSECVRPREGASKRSAPLAPEPPGRSRTRREAFKKGGETTERRKRKKKNSPSSNPGPDTQARTHYRERSLAFFCFSFSSQFWVRFPISDPVFSHRAAATAAAAGQRERGSSEPKSERTRVVVGVKLLGQGLFPRRPWPSPGCSRHASLSLALSPFSLRSLTLSRSLFLSLSRVRGRAGMRERCAIPAPVALLSRCDNVGEGGLRGEHGDGDPLFPLSPLCLFPPPPFSSVGLLLPLNVLLVLSTSAEGGRGGDVGGRRSNKSCKPTYARSGFALGVRRSFILCSAL